MLHYYRKRESSEVNSNAQNLTQPQNWPQICEAPPTTVFPAGIRSSSRSWTTSGLQVTQLNLFWIPLRLMCFTCVSLASPPCGCSVWHLIARSCVLHSRFCQIAICRWCHFLFEGKRVRSQFDSKCWTLNCFLCHCDNKQQGLMSLEGFDSTGTL